MNFADELRALLEEEYKCIVRLNELSLVKKDIIMSGDMVKLNDVTKEEESLVNQIGTLEVERSKLLDSWGVAIDTPISSVINTVVEGKEALIDIKDKMAAIIFDLNENNQLNSSLIRENLEWIDFNMNLMRSVETPSGYGMNSQEKKDGGSSIFDRKV